MKFLTVFFVSIMPISGLEANLNQGISLGLPVWIAYAASVLGNMLPIPFLLVILKEIFKTTKRRESKKKKSRERIKELVILIVASIPMPFPMGWVGAILAAIFRLPLVKSIVIIAIGTIISGLIVIVKPYIF